MSRAPRAGSGLVKSVRNALSDDPASEAVEAFIRQVGADTDRKSVV